MRHADAEVSVIVRRLLARPALWVALAIGAGLVGLSQLVEIRTPNRPTGSWQEIRGLAERSDLNLVFVLIDTLRADRLSAYGYERETSPILAALADSGVRFGNTLAQSTWTKCSMASLWSASYPAVNRITRYPDAVPDAMESPAEILRAAGYRTVGIYRNAWVANNFGFAQGFDLYLRPTVMRRRPGLAQKNPSAFRLPGTDQDVTRSARQFLQAPQARDRFFLYLHYMDVHQYVYDNAVDFGTSFSDIYDNSIRWVDANLGTLVATLQNQELMERTLLVIASDHGEAFHEHGREGHAIDIHRETTHVPLVLALPFRLSEGIVVESPVENVDIWPTLLDLLGLPPLPHVDGRSLVPLIEAAARGEERPDERLRFAYLDQNWGVRNSKREPLASVGDGRYRLLRDAKRAQLFDVQADPGEKRNLASARPEVVKRLEVLLQEHLARPEPEWGPPEHVALTDLELVQLRALGYAVPGQEAEAGDAGGGQPGPK